MTDKSKKIFFLSQMGFAYYCDYFLCHRTGGRFPYDAHIDTEKLFYLPNGSKIFLNLLSPNHQYFMDHIIHIFQLNNRKYYFYIMYEPEPPLHYINRLLPYTIHMFVNNNYYYHPQIHSLPIGIRDGEEVFKEHLHFKERYLMDESKRNDIVKNILCLLCFTNNHEERTRCEKILGNENFVVNLNKEEYPQQPSIHCGKIPVWVNYEKTHESVYVLCPRGVGEDTHRFYEAIFLDSIPIVKRTFTAFDKLYDVFPCLIVNDWNEITESFLLQNLEECRNKLVLFKEKYPTLYTNLENIEELLMKT
jgi:hypothetical protein